MKVKFENIICRVEGKVNAQTTDIPNYLGKGHGECGEIAITQHGDLLKDRATLGMAFRFSFKKGDVLFMSRSFSNRKAGMAMFDGICSEKTFVLRTKDGNILLQKYLPLIIQNDEFWEYCEENKAGGVNNFINWKTIANYELDIPSIEEQKIIANKTWAAYRLKEGYKKLLAATDEMVKSQFIEMFGDSNKYHKKQISDVAEVIAGGDRPKDISEVMTDEYRYPIYANGIENEGLQCYSKEFRVDKTAVTISARGTIGATFIRPPYFTPVVRLITVIPKAELNPVFLKYAIDYAELISNGSSQQQLTIPNVKKIEVVIPPVNKQNNYASFVVQSDKSKFYG